MYTDLYKISIPKHVAFCNNFGLKLQNYATKLGIPQLAVEKFQRDLEQYLQYLLDIEQGDASKMKKKLRNEMRAKLTEQIHMIRDMYLKYNKEVDDAMWVDLGFLVLDDTKTPVQVPKIVPDVEIDFSTHLRHYIIFGKYNSKMKIVKGLPKGASGVQVWRYVGGDTPPAYEEMEFLGEESKSPYEVEYKTKDWAEKVWYAVRYYNVKGGGFGPWSLIKVALVN
jgi:hypothetical protein